MDFFARQDEARRRSVRWVMLFGLCVAGLVGALNLVAAGALGLCTRFATPEAATWLQWDWRMVAGVSGLAVFCVGSGIAIERLNLGSGATLAERLGASPVPLHPTNLREHQLLNLVEEMAIASGVPAPCLFVLRGEPSINALTAGRRHGDAAIIVTAGAVENLTRDELQGMVAHEFGHLLHHDVELNLRLVTLLSGLLFIPEIGLDLLRAGRAEPPDEKGSDVGKGPTLALLIAPAGLALLIVGFLGYLTARALQAAMARQRDLLADAVAVQFTRNPGGLGGALQKIGAAPAQRLTGAAAAAKLGHLYFVESNRHRVLDWFSTHPSLQARLTAILPDGTPAPAAAPAPTSSPLAVARDTMADLRTDLGSFIEASGTPTALHLSHARDFIAGLSPEIRAATLDPCGGPALVLALLFARDATARARQRALLHAAPADRRAGPELPAPILAALDRLANAVSPLPRAARLPLLNLSLPAVRALPDSCKEPFLAAARQLAAADDEIQLFEFALLKALERSLRVPAGFALLGEPVGVNLTVLAAEVGAVLSTIARAGAVETSDAETAFTAAIELLPALRGRVQLLPASACGLETFGAALDCLTAAAPGLRRVILAACARAAGSDGTITPDEAELLRAVGDTLDCPIPPLLDGPSD